MKKLVFLYLSFITVVGLSQKTTTLNGSYMNQNMYIQNPFCNKEGTKLCVDSVWVNGKRCSDNICSTAFEIDLRAFNLTEGDSIEIKLFHNSNCLPKVLNPGLGPSIGDFVVKEIQIRGNTLHWKTIEEGGKLPIIIEQYKWNKWVKVGEVNGVGLPNGIEYQHPINLITGENKFRVKQVGLDRRPRISSITKIDHPTRKKSLSYKYIKENNAIVFEEVTSFELFDAMGNMVDRGKTDSIDVKDRKKGRYFLNYDNVIGEVIVIE